MLLGADLSFVFFAFSFFLIGRLRFAFMFISYFGAFGGDRHFLEQDK